MYTYIHIHRPLLQIYRAHLQNLETHSLKSKRLPIYIYIHIYIYIGLFLQIYRAHLQKNLDTHSFKSERLPIYTYIHTYICIGLFCRYVGLICKKEIRRTLSQVKGITNIYIDYQYIYMYSLTGESVCHGFFANEPYISAKEAYVSTKDPHFYVLWMARVLLQKRKKK